MEYTLRLLLEAPTLHSFQVDLIFHSFDEMVEVRERFKANAARIRRGPTGEGHTGWVGLVLMQEIKDLRGGQVKL